MLKMITFRRLIYLITFPLRVIFCIAIFIFLILMVLMVWVFEDDKKPESYSDGLGI